MDHCSVVPPNVVSEFPALQTPAEVVTHPRGATTDKQVSVVVMCAGVKRPQDIFVSREEGEDLGFQPNLVVQNDRIRVAPKQIIVTVKIVQDKVELGPGNGTAVIPHILSTNVKIVAMFGSVGAFGGQARLHRLFVIGADAKSKNGDPWFAGHLLSKYAGEEFRRPRLDAEAQKN